MEKTIVVLAAVTQDALEAKGADVEYTHCQTLKEAKERATYYLTHRYQDMCESSERLTYARILINGKIVWDFEAFHGV